MMTPSPTIDSGKRQVLRWKKRVITGLLKQVFVVEVSRDDLDTGFSRKDPFQEVLCHTECQTLLLNRPQFVVGCEVLGCSFVKLSIHYKRQEMYYLNYSPIQFQYVSCFPHYNTLRFVL